MTRRQRSPVVTWALPIGLCLTLFLVSYNVSVVPAIMPSIVRDLSSSVGYIQSALVLLALVQASFAPTCENLVKRYGRKRVYIGGLGLFMIGVLATCLSPNVGLFVLTYSFMTGLAATPLIGSPRDLVIRTYDDKAEKYAMLALIVCSVLGGLTGALLGGWLASNYGWRWAFVPELLLVPMLAILLRSVPYIPPTETAPIDWVGGLLSLLGFGLTLMGVSLGSEYGWWTPTQPFVLFKVTISLFSLSIVPPLIASGLICLGLFASWQRRQADRGKASLMRVGLLRHTPFLLGILTATLHTLVTTGIQFNLYQFIPVVMRLNPFQTAQAVLPFPLAVIAAAFFTTFKLIGRVPPKTIIYTGLSIFCFGLGWLYLSISPTMTPLSLLPALIAMGLGSGTFLAQIGILAFSMVKDTEYAEANGIYNPFQNLGSALGRAILGTTLIATASIKIVDQGIETLEKTVTPTQRAQAITRLVQVIQTYSREERKAFFGQLPAAIQPSLNTILNTAAIEAMQIAILVALVLSFLCLLSAVFLPKRALRKPAKA